MCPSPSLSLSLPFRSFVLPFLLGGKLGVLGGKLPPNPLHWVTPCKVSHSSSFLSSVGREGGFHLAYHQYFLVLVAARKGGSFELPLNLPLCTHRARSIRPVLSW
jgi:hypothetical protein